MTIPDFCNQSENKAEMNSNCKKMTILYSCNQNYVNQTMVSVCSVMEHNSVWIEFILISDNLSDFDKNRIRELIELTGNQIRFVEISSIPELEEVYTDGVHPRSIYAKLFPDQLTDAERILYLDSDVIATAAFTELFSIDLKENVIAGTAMPYPLSVLERQKIKGGTYICDGIVLIDVHQWKSRQLSKKGKEYFHLCHGKPERMSESVMNYVCEGNILLLPPKYHLMPQFLLFDSMKIKRMYRISDYYSQEEIEKAKASPVFIHYMNELYNRPWCKKSKNNRWNHPCKESPHRCQSMCLVSDLLCCSVCLEPLFLKRLRINLYCICRRSYMIKVENVSMRFRMANDRIVSLKEYAIAMLKRQLKYRDFWVFRKISFEVKKGEVVGIIGKNGAGKSTLLKIIAGVLSPSEGRVILEGNVVPMLELGSGFDMELSGRENIFLNGSILGYGKDFLEEKYEEILEFSELKEFIDMPIRNYSSGMLMRLAFSIATVVKPEILIVDEILAVGDEAFQRKSKRKMLELMSGGTTVLFVSHSIDQIREMCNRVVWLEHGGVNMIGEAKKVCDAYQEFMSPSVSLESQIKEKKRNTDAERYYMDVLFVYGEIGGDYEWRVHNQKEQLLAGNMASSEIYYQDISEKLISRYRVFFFIGCPNTEKLTVYIRKLKTFHKTILFDCRGVEEWNSNRIFQELRGEIDGIVAATKEVAEEATKEGFAVFFNRDVCSDRIEQLSEWAVYDRDILPERDVNQMSGDMEIVNYYRAVKKKEERENRKLQIGCFDRDAEAVGELLNTIFAYELEATVFLNPDLKGKNAIWKNKGQVIYWESIEREKLPGIYAELDMVLSIVRNEKEERQAEQGKIYAGLSKTPFFIWNRKGITKEKADSEFYAETAEEFYQKIMEVYQEKKELKKRIEDTHQWIKEEATAVRTGWRLAAWIRKKQKAQVVFLLKDGMEPEKKKNIYACASQCKKQGMDVLLLWNSGYHPMEGEEFLPALSRAESYIFGSFDQVIATSWEECEFLQSYSNMKKRFLLQQDEKMEEYSSGDYTRFRMMQAYEPCVEMTFLVKEEFYQRYVERLKRENVSVKCISSKAEEWWKEFI